MKRLKRWQYDLILSICLLVFVIVCIIYAIILESPRVKLLLARPDMYLAMWLVILGGLSLVLFVRALTERNTPSGQEYPPRIWNPLAAFTVLVLILYLLILKKIGYIIDSVLLCWSLSIAYSFADKTNSDKEQKKSKRFHVSIILVKTFVFSTVCSVTSYLLFTKILNARLPRFSLF